MMKTWLSINPTSGARSHTAAQRTALWMDRSLGMRARLALSGCDATQRPQIEADHPVAYGARIQPERDAFTSVGAMGSG